MFRLKTVSTMTGLALRRSIAPNDSRRNHGYLVYIVSLICMGIRLVIGLREDVQSLEREHYHDPV